MPTRAGSPQQHKPITVGPFYLTHPVNFPCGRKPEYPGKTHDFGRALTFFLLFSHEDWVRVALRKYLVRFEPAASEVKGKCANHLATEAPLALPTRAGSPQQHMPITVGPFYLTHPVNFSCGRKPEYPGKTHDFRQSVDFLLFSHEDWVRVALRKYLVRFEPAASEVKGKCANHLATEAPQMIY